MAIEKIEGKELTIELSYRCNLECKHCSSVNIPGELTKQQIFDAIEKIKPDILRVSGGEPLLHNLDKLGIFDSGIKIILSTAGIGETRYLSDFDIKLVRFSVYGDKKFHNFITQRNSYNATIQVLRRYIARSNSPVQLTTPIFEKTQLSHVITLAEDLGISVRIAKLLLHGRAKKYPELVLSRDEQVSIASNYLNNANVIVTDSLVESQVCNKKQKFTLLPNGKIISCVANKHGSCDNKTCHII